MSKNLHVFLAFLGLAIVAGCSSDPGEPTASTPVTSDDLAPALDIMSRERIEAHLMYLADDAREGRMTGTVAYDETAAYVARHFDEFGLAPGGDDGGWYQQVPMLANRIDVESASVVYHQDTGDGSLTWKEDFVMAGDSVRPETQIRAEVVFVGFGIPRARTRVLGL